MSRDMKVFLKTVGIWWGRRGKAPGSLVAFISQLDTPFTLP